MFKSSNDINNLAGIEQLVNKNTIKSVADLKGHVDSYIENNTTTHDVHEALDEIDEEITEAADLHPQHNSMHGEPTFENDFTHVNDAASDTSCRSKKSFINNEKFRKVMGDIEDNSVIVDNYEERKNMLLYEIEEFQDTLVLNDIFKEKKYNVTINTPLPKLNEIHTLLKIKCDKTRCIIMGVKMLEGIAWVMGMVFDGERKLGSLEFDLTGWHREVKRKALTFRSDIGNCFENSVSANMSPLTRILLELSISGMIYGSTNAKRKKNITTSFEPLSTFK